MVDRYMLDRNATELREAFGAFEGDLSWWPKWNLAPGQSVPVLRRHPKTGKRSFDLLDWAYPARRGPNGAIMSRVHNVRAEGIERAEAFRDSLWERRCLIPATGFWVWQAAQGQRLPHAVQLGDGGRRSPPTMRSRIFAFAGIWTAWRSAKTNEIERAVAIITVPSNERLAPLSERMPAILPNGDYGAWLGEVAIGPGDVLAMMMVWPADQIASWRVGEAVTLQTNEGANLLSPASEED